MPAPPAAWPGTAADFWAEAEALGRALAGHLEYLESLEAPGLALARPLPDR